MTDSQYLLAVLAVVYLLECVAWVHAQAVAFRWYSARRGSGTFAPGHFGNPEGGVVLKPPIATLGYFFVSRSLPISFSPWGAFSFVSDAPSRELRCKQCEQFRSWDQVRNIRRQGKEVIIDGITFVVLGSSHHAQRTCDLLKGLAESRPEKRAERIQTLLQGTLDTSVIQRRLDEFQDGVGGLQFCCSMLFLVLFLVGPLCTLRFGIEQVWLPLGVAILILHFAIAWLFVRQFRKWYPQSADEKWVHVVSMVLNPAAAARAIDRLSRDLFCQFDPVAVARVLCSQKYFRSVARGLLVDLRYPFLPICPGGHPEALKTEEWSRTARLAMVEEFLSGAGLSSRELLAAQPPDDATARSFCPRCERHFEQEEGQCEPCGGIPTQSWDAAGTAASAMWNQ